MKKIIALSSVVILFSCASKKEDQIENRKIELDSSITSIKEEDFRAKAKVQYSRSNDRIALKSPKLTTSQALAKESFEKGDIYDESSLDDKVSRLASLCYEKDYDDAKVQIKSLYDAYKENVIYWNQVGSCFLGQKEYRLALLYFNKGLEIKSNYAPILNNLGVLNERKGYYREAFEAYRRAIDANKYAKTPKYNYSQLALQFGLFAKSQSYIESMYRSSPQDQDLILMMANLRLQMNRANEALKFFSALNRNYRKKSGVMLNHSLALFQSGNKKDAKSLFDDIDKEFLNKNFHAQKIAQLIGAN